MVIDKLPRATPEAIIAVEFNRQNHFSFAVPAITVIFVCAIQENLLEQLKYRFFNLVLFASQFVILCGHVQNSNRF